MRFLLTALLLASPLLQGQMEIPQADPLGEIIHHSGFTLSYNEDHEQANWVAYELTKAEVEGKVGRTNNFRPDSLVSTGSATLADYRGSGYGEGTWHRLVICSGR